MNSPIARWAAMALVAVATMCAIATVAAVLFLNPIWVGFEQERSDVSAWTGYTPQQVRDVTGSILSDLVFGPPSFAVEVNGTPVLDDRERGHMVDVRNVFYSVGLVALGAWILLLAGAVVGRGGRTFWRAVRAGALVLVGGVVVVGAAFALLFDQAFELMHEMFFASGTYTFDPRTERLVQLFPDQFWSETSVALALVVLALAVGVVALSGRMARPAGEAVAAASTSPDSPPQAPAAQ